MENEKSDQKDQQEIDLLYILAVCWKYKIAILISTTIVGILSIIYVLMITPYYSSSVKMYGAIKGTSGPVNELIASLGLTAKTTSLYIPEIVESRDIAKRVVSRKYKMGKDSVTLIEFWELDKETISEELRWDSAVSSYMNMVKIQRDNETELLTLTVELPDEKLPSQVATAIHEEVTRFLREIYKETFRMARTYAEEMIEKTQRELDQVEEELTDFMNKNQIIASPSLKMLISKKRDEYGLLDQVLSMLKKQREIIRVEEVKDRPVVYVIQQADDHEYPVRPKKKKVVIFYTVIGFILSCIAVILKQRYITEESIKMFKYRMKKL